ncbi:MAG: class I SAM-dependent RNA methyltransferase [Chthoniobacteraceae bacterium]|nr:class I SAM-dependent RNA methyltransferase [Chthoniobacteraceae bacterium]
MQLTVHDIAFGGKGVGRSEGLVVFVPYTIPGESITVEITRKKKNYAEAELISVETPSPDRVTPECPYFGRCGGCAYQHIAYPAQLALKSAQVEQTLRRVGKLAEVPMRPIVPSPKPYGYRNRIRVHVAEGVTGFYAADGVSLLDVTRCPIASDEVNERLTGLRARRMPDGDYTLSEARKKGFFEQTNNAVAQALLDLVAERITPGGSLVDAYCGAGFFAQHLRERFEQVVGIEENEFAIAHARSHAGPNERYLAGDVGQFLGEVLAETGDTSVVLDPPAAGITARVSDAILAAAPREILYVSCNPGTLARDLSTLCRTFRLESVTPLDMFPQTAEIEVLAHLKKK